MIHKLKTVQPYYTDVVLGHKTFEIRRNDRKFRLNDILLLEEYSPATGYSGKSEQFEVIYITRYNQRDDYVVMGIRRKW